MASKKLSVTKISSLKPTDKPYKVTDGEGLFLLVHPNGSLYWRLAYRFDSKQKTLALGVYPRVSLAEARELRDTARDKIARGFNPAQTSKVAAELFSNICEEWFRKKKLAWSESNTQKLRSRLNNDIIPWLGNKRIEDITARDALLVVQKAEARGAVNTAHQLRTTIGQILRYGVATDRIQYVVTDALRGALITCQPKHHAAITDPAQLGHLLRSAHNYTGNLIVKSALLLTILTFVRQGELRYAEWSEYDMDNGIWSIPAEKMKMKEAHIVPLSTQVIQILTELKQYTGGGKYVFPNARRDGGVISENTVSMALRGLGYARDQVTPHGFRATARTLLDEVLHSPIEHIEQQLAHQVKDPLGRAYNRTKHLPQRKEMMQAWADYLDKLAGK